MKEKMQRFMAGRYGVDGLGRFLNITALVLMVLGLFVLRPLYWLGFALVIYEWVRMLSRNTQKRIQENYAFYALRNRVIQRWNGWKRQFAQRKTHCFFRCPQCRQRVRVPRGRGKIAITCPRCHTEFIKKS